MVKILRGPTFFPVTIRSKHRQFSRLRMRSGLFWVPIAFLQPLLLPISRDQRRRPHLGSLSFDNSFIYSIAAHFPMIMAHVRQDGNILLWSGHRIQYLSTPPYFSSFPSRLGVSDSGLRRVMQHGDGRHWIHWSQAWRRRSQKLQQQNTSKNCVIGSCKTIDTW